MIMDLNVGDRVIYKPATKRKGLAMPHKKSTVIATYPDRKQIRIVCDGENIRRRVNDQYVERL